MTEHLATRPAALGQCSHCGTTVIIATMGGLTTVTETTPLSIAEEIAALITGKATFDLTINGRRVYLEHRDLPRIRGSRDHPVVAQHPCAAASSRPLPPVTAAEVPDDPPF